jgi:phosphoenolpyruvate-protein kinase (PTS system EI component)
MGIRELPRIGAMIETPAAALSIAFSEAACGLFQHRFQ